MTDSIHVVALSGGKDSTAMALIKAEIEARIGGAYHLPDGRKFWIDTATVREIINRIAPAIVTAIDQSQADLVAALTILLEEAENFTVSGVSFTEECMGHKGPDLARAALERAKGDADEQD